MPISRVRSVTDTSMMFMMPMPPTRRLTAATAERNAVRISVALVHDLRDLLQILDVEIVDLARNDVADLAHQALDHVLDVGNVLRPVDRDADDIDFGVAGDACAARP